MAEAADDIFRRAARREGYLKEDTHEPGNGRGILAWYRDNGLIHPGDTRTVGVEMPLDWYPELGGNDCE
jgi:hypothetical protein